MPPPLTRSRKKSDIGIVYTLTSPSGKQYVGITTKRLFEKRMQKHRSSSSQCVALKNAIQKYGWENFKVEFREVPVETLNEEEQEQIKRLNTMAPNGYNLTSGGERCKASDETKKRISAAAKKMWEDQEYIEKQSAAQKKAFADPAVKKRMSAAQKKVQADPAVKRRKRAASKKMWEDPEYSKKISAATKKQWEDPEYSEKISKKIVVTNLLTNKATTYASGKEAIKETGLNESTIISCCKARQVATGEYSIRHEKESDDLKKKHEEMLKVLTDTPCDVQTERGRHLKSFNSAVEAVRWIRDEKQIKPNFLTVYKALTGTSKGYYGQRGRAGVRIVRRQRSQLHMFFTSGEK
jgi:group I intron endonuclease